MAPIVAKSKESGTMSSSSSPAVVVARAPSRAAQAVAHQVADDEDATVASTPPGTPPRGTSPIRSKQQQQESQSALKRLAGRFRTRRSLSAPPTLRRRRRPDKLLEEHFVLEKAPEDEKVVVLLPGVPRHEENWARDLHDFFNLVVLVPVVALNLMNWNWEMLLYKNHEMENLGSAWTGEYFLEFFWVTALYFITDLLWITVVPTCVRSPSVIVQHHVATLLYIYVPFRVLQGRWFMGACMSVEVNTWLLIARRVFNKQGFPPWTIIDLSFFSIRVKLISILFYITWIGIRCILYPMLLVDIWKAYSLYSHESGSHMNLLLVCFPLHAIFCLLNLKWSWDLLCSKIRYWRRKGGAGATDDVAKDKGL